MSVIRGKFFTDREITPSGKTVGNWPFKHLKTGVWVNQDSKEEFELKSLLDLLREEDIQVEDESELPTRAAAGQ